MTLPEQQSTARSVFAETRQSLANEAWVRRVQDIWPAPIANELEQSLTMLADGVDAGGILMQIRDTAEVLLKTLNLVVVADLVAHGGMDRQVAARQGLFGGTLSLGGWRAMLQRLNKLGTEGLLVPEILALGDPAAPFQQAMETYVAQRNEDIGHGAYRPDSIEIALAVERQWLGKYERRTGYSGGLDRAFRAVHESELWDDCTIHVDAPDGPALQGAASRSLFRQGAGKTYQGHTHAPRSLYLVRNGRSLNLAPFIAGRLCKECNNSDTFLFDSPRYFRLSENTDLSFTFIDWANGHRLRVNAKKTEPALAELASVPLDDLSFVEATQGEGEFSNRDVVRLLDDILFDYRFLSPDWLRERLQRHMRERPSGVFWLRAPAHVGKSTFVHGLFGEGLDEKARTRQRELLGKETTIEVLPLFLKREYRFDVAQFAMAFENRARLLARDDTRLKLSLPREGSSAEKQAGFVAFLSEVAKAARWRSGADRLIVAVEGLDELREPAGGASAIDYIPGNDAIPDGVTLLLTSRPASDCPPWLQLRMPTLAPGHERHGVSVDDPGYVALLRRYIGLHSGVPEGDPDFERTAATILRQSESLFLIVSFLCDLIREGSVAGSDAASRTMTEPEKDRNESPSQRPLSPGV